MFVLACCGYNWMGILFVSPMVQWLSIILKDVFLDGGEERAERGEGRGGRGRGEGGR